MESAMTAILSDASGKCIMGYYSIVVWFEVMNEMFISIVYVFKLSICIVALSSLHFKLWFSPVALVPYHSDH